LYAYVVLSVTTGLRTEELRALRWDEVDLDVGTVAVYRAVRAVERASGDTKTQQSRRVLLLPHLTVEALREHRKRQAADRLAAGAPWRDHGLVFASAVERRSPSRALGLRPLRRVLTQAQTLDCDLPRFGLAPVGRIARTGDGRDREPACCVGSRFLKVQVVTV
jgi:integrase